MPSEEVDFQAEDDWMQWLQGEGTKERLLGEDDKLLSASEVSNAD